MTALGRLAVSAIGIAAIAAAAIAEIVGHHIDRALSEYTTEIPDYVPDWVVEEQQ